MIEIQQEKCDKCATCVGVCPVNALQMTNQLAVELEICISCGTCVQVCPFGALIAIVEKKRKGTA